MKKVASGITTAVCGVPVVCSNFDPYQKSAVVPDHFPGGLGKSLIEICYTPPIDARRRLVFISVVHRNIKSPRNLSQTGDCNIK